MTHDNSAEVVAQMLVQHHLDFWNQLESNYRQTNDPLVRESAVFHVGALKTEFETALRATTNRTPFQDVGYRFAQAGLPRVNALIASADAEQLQSVLEGMVTWRPDYEPDDAWDVE